MFNLAEETIDKWLRLCNSVPVMCKTKHLWMSNTVKLFNAA